MNWGQYTIMLRNRGEWWPEKQCWLLRNTLVLIGKECDIEEFKNKLRQYCRELNHALNGENMIPERMTRERMNQIAESVTDLLWIHYGSKRD